MVNLNGTILTDEVVLTENRAFLYGDAVFETVKIVDGRVLFMEDHYFRLMASMRIVRMQIPMNFTLEFLEKELLQLAELKSCAHSSRARITVFRNNGGFYLPKTRTVSYLIHVEPKEIKNYTFSNDPYEVELFKDFHVSNHLLSTIKSTNKLIQTVGSIFADENGYQNCLLINEDKNIVEALNGNLFMLTGNRLVTPPLSDGCLNGVMRKQILSIAKKLEELEVVEESISPFSLQKADELFITNVIVGIQPISKYRKKEFETTVAFQLIELLNSRENLINLT
jgi:branched-chain amino acid aminotransferase